MAIDQRGAESAQPETIKISDFEKMLKTMRPILFLVGAGMAVGLLGGFLYSISVAKEWEAHAMVRIGLAMRDLNKIEIIESQANVVERMRDAMNKQEVSRLLRTNSTWTSQDSQLLLRSLKASIVPGTDFIRISARGHSMEAAKAIVDAVITKLRTTHDKIARSSLEDMEQRLAYIESKIAAKQKDVSRLENQTIPLLRQKELGTAQVMLLKSMMDNASDQLNAFQRERLESLRIIKMIQTNPTAPIGGIYVESTPVFPNQPKVLVIAVVLGGMIGAFFAWCLIKWKARY